LASFFLAFRVTLALYCFICPIELSFGGMIGRVSLHLACGFLCAITVTIAFGAFVSATSRIENIFEVLKGTPFCASLGLGAGLLARLIAFGFLSQLSK
jgi:hypothetical protein